MIEELLKGLGIPKRWEHIIIHHSASPDGYFQDFDGIKNYHVNHLGWNDIGYHYILENIKGRYKILKGRLLDTTGAHCYQERMNHKGIGICVIGNYDLKEPDISQYYAVGMLCRELMRAFTISIANIQPHNRYANYKSCPGKKFDMMKLYNCINGGVFI